jgi:16S rRNA (guanine527-N7)-methyltransferase
MTDPETIGETEFVDRVLTVIEPLEIERPEMLARHAWLVREKNKVMNLTRIVEPEAMAVKHIMDSLAALPLLQGTEEVSFKKIVDLGTGAGWPGLALAIAIPGLEVVLVDSTKKKIDFLNEVVTTLGLGCQVQCVWSRFEDFIRDERHDTDLVVSRATGPLKDILEWCTNRWFGHLLLWKGPKLDEELREARPLMQKRKLEVALDEPYELPGDDFVRRLVMIA